MQCYAICVLRCLDGRLSNAGDLSEDPVRVRLRFGPWELLAPKKLISIHRKFVHKNSQGSGEQLIEWNIVLPRPRNS